MHKVGPASPDTTARRSYPHMTRLQNRWYNALVRSLHLNPAMFQISLPVLPVMASDRALWAYQDVIPPVSLTFNRSTGESPVFSKQYLALARQINSPASSLEHEIGTGVYKEWQSYLAQQPVAPSPTEIPALFQRWAMLFAPSVALVGASNLARTVLANVAHQTPTASGAPNDGPQSFIGSYADLTNALSCSDRVSIHFHSEHASEDVQNTWTGGRNNGIQGLCAAMLPDSELSRKFALSTVVVDASFDKYAVWASIPGPWYNSSLLQAAYANRGMPPWTANSDPVYDDLFGPRGTMRYFIASLLIAEGMDVTITSTARFSDEDRKHIENSLPGGVWPFYFPDSDVAATKVYFDGPSETTFRIAVQPRQPFVMGNNVLGIDQYLGHARR